MQIPQTRVERLERSRLANLNERDFDHRGSVLAQFSRKSASLLPRTPNQHAHSTQRRFIGMTGVHFSFSGTFVPNACWHIRDRKSVVGKECRCRWAAEQ